MINTILIAAENTPTEMDGKSWAVVILIGVLLIGIGGKGGRGR